MSGAILPVVALGFIKSLVDYIRPEKPEELEVTIGDRLGDIETPVAGSAEPIIEKQIIPDVSEELPEED